LLHCAVLLWDRVRLASNLLGSLAPLVVNIVVAEGTRCRRSTQPNDMLLYSAVLALCKFMCISADFCSKHLQVCVCAVRSIMPCAPTHVLHSHLTSPHLTSPHLTSSHLTKRCNR
jgi:hypothetical protein